MDKEEISSMVACATVLPPTNSLSLAVQGAGFASGALASASVGLLRALSWHCLDGGGDLHEQGE